ncbi:MAG TPA: purine-nucleoside phosphorylase [Acidimicrobiia bacterium]|nr:purine-nucleoside phosphorylase [Acidimicrobiia bacterium]
MSTPHISAEKGDFAPSILLPGDPLRAKHIADNFLDEVKQVNEVRNMLGFTGVYEGIPISVMGTGMGIPSASIYATELISEYGVERLIRVGSCGGILASVKIRDVILAIGACTDSLVNRMRYGGYDFSATADYRLLRAAADSAAARGIEVKVGNVHSADLFYNPDSEAFDRMEAMGVLAVEMEAAGLYGVAAEKGGRALTIATVSDHVRTGEATSSEERQQTFDEMVMIALEAVKIDVGS